MYMYIYIYIYIERERDMYIYIYIYIVFIIHYYLLLFISIDCLLEVIIYKPSERLTDYGWKPRRRLFGSKEPFAGRNLLVCSMRMKNRGVRFRRVRGFKRNYFNSRTPPTSQSRPRAPPDIHNMYTYMCICMCVYIYIYDTYTYTCIHRCVYIYIYICMLSALRRGPASVGGWSRRASGALIHRQC